MGDKYRPDSLVFRYYRGRVGLYAILRALGIGVGDEVALQAFTCVAVPEGVMATGARPLYIDVEVGGVNMDPADLSHKITQRTKVIIVQHTYGIPADIEEILRIAVKRGISVIEDCCHTYNSTLGGRTVGSFGVASFYSFEWGKPIVLGIGGGVRANNEILRSRLAEFDAQLIPPPWSKVWKISLQCMLFDTLLTPRSYWWIRAAFRRLSKMGIAEGNYHPVNSTNPSSEFGWRMIGSLAGRYEREAYSRLERFTKHSRTVCSEYTKHLSTSARLPICVTASDIVYARFPLLVADRPKLIERAKAQRLEIAEWYTSAVHPLKSAELEVIQYKNGSCPEAEKRATEIISLPVYSRVKSADIERYRLLLESVCS